MDRRSFLFNIFLDSYKERKVKLTPPKQITFWISLILGVLGLLGKIVSLGFLSTFAFWLVLAALVLLVLALLFKGL
jgi:hypothetical protein